MSIKAAVKRTGKRIMGSDHVWALTHSLLVRPSDRLRKFRTQLVKRRVLEAAATKGVLDGSMTGLKYPSFKSHGSTLFPKLTGSYESEIAPWIREAQKKAYSAVIDIGCAEGYYAVGFAAFGNAPNVIAFDIAPAARELCDAMSKLNGVEAKMSVRELCTPEFLRDFDFGDGGLIICDVEGAEGELFTPDNLSNFRNCDLVIEVHRSPDFDNHKHLESLFSKTHEVRFEPAISDPQKVQNSPVDFPFDPDPEIRLELVKECRSRSTGWLLIEARNGD